MSSVPFDPKAGEKAYYANLGPEGLAHARGKPWSDADCGKYLADLAAILTLMDPTRRRVLDFGCGTGWTSLLLGKAGYDVTGVDISADAIAIARENAAREGLTGLTFYAADYEEWVGTGDFDYVLFYDALHHAEDEQAAMAAAFRSLTTGGVLFAIEPGEGHSQSSGAAHAVETYQVHEKDMPPHYIWKLGRAAGFSRRLFLPAPRDVFRTTYRKDYFKKGSRPWLEKIWGLFRLLTKFGQVKRAGLTVLWK